ALACRAAELAVAPEPAHIASSVHPASLRRPGEPGVRRLLVLEERMKQHVLGIAVAIAIFASFAFLRPMLASKGSHGGTSPGRATLVLQAEREFGEIDRILTEGNFHPGSAEKADVGGAQAQLAPLLVVTRAYTRPDSPLSRQGSPGILQVRQEVF